MASSASSTPPAPAVLHTDAPLRDFSDRLSPMVVKELRQGLRSPLFIWLFIIMHAALTVIVLLTATEGSRYTAGFFWFPVIITLVFLLPLRGMGALLDEKRLNTLDTLVLTKLSASRITFGKWVAIAAQILLLGLTVFPYMIMRYFAGAINVALELRVLCHFLLMGCLLAAVTVGFSWIKIWLVRGVLVLGAGFLIGGMAVGMMEMIAYDSRMPGGKEELAMTALAWFLAAYVIYYLLDFAAAQIAPKAENRSSMRRVVSLVVLGILLVLLMSIDNLGVTRMIESIGLVIAIVAGIDAATEPTQHLSIITLPFVKRGWLGKCVGRLLYPGWHTGVNFMLVLGVMGWGCHFYGERTGDFRFTANYLVWMGKVCFGLWIVYAFLPRLKPTLVALLIVLIATQTLGYMFASAADQWEFPALGVLAHFSPLAPMYESDLDHLDDASNPAIQALIFLALLAWRARREFAFTRQIEAQAQADLAEEKQSQLEAAGA